MPSQTENLDRAIRILRHIDSSIRSGQMTYAYRDINNLLSWLYRGEISLDDQYVTDRIIKNLRRAASIIRPIVDTLGLVNRAMGAAKALKNVVEENNKGEDNGTERNDSQSDGKQ